MKKLLVLSVLALGALSIAANAAPVKLSKSQMAGVTAGANPNVEPNGTIGPSQGKSGAPGNSFHPGK